MERRKEPRAPAEQSVFLVALSAEGTHQKPVVAQLIESSASGLRLILPSALAAGTPVRIEYANRLLLGEIVFCGPSGDGWTAGIRVQHVIADLASLEKLRKAIEDEQRAAVGREHSGR